MPDENQLKLRRTFEDQYNLVNSTVIPTVMEALDSDMFPVSEIIVYDMIHNRHKHQREEYLRKKQPLSIQDKQARRKHQNSRRNEVSNKLVLFNSFYFLPIYNIL
jgi:hypothetical protein